MPKEFWTAASLAAVLSLPVVGQAAQAPSSKQVKDKDPEPVDCDNRAPRVRAVKLAAPIFNTVDFSGTNGAFDPVPLLEAIIFVGGKKDSYVIAHFSSQVSTGDNTVVFQASIDDVPMDGHTLFPDELRSPQLTIPIVLDRGTLFSPTTPIPVPTLASYNFSQIVKPSLRTVRIKWAGCCSLDPASVSAETLAAVLTLEYRGHLTKQEDDDD